MCLLMVFVAHVIVDYLQAATRETTNGTTVTFYLIGAGQGRRLPPRDMAKGTRAMY